MRGFDCFALPGRDSCPFKHSRRPVSCEEWLKGARPSHEVDPLSRLVFCFETGVYLAVCENCSRKARRKVLGTSGNGQRSLGKFWMPVGFPAIYYQADNAGRENRRTARAALVIDKESRFFPACRPTNSAAHPVFFQPGKPGFRVPIPQTHSRSSGLRAIKSGNYLGRSCIVVIVAGGAPHIAEFMAGGAGPFVNGRRILGINRSLDLCFHFSQEAEGYIDLRVRQTTKREMAKSSTAASFSEGFMRRIPGSREGAQLVSKMSRRAPVQRHGSQGGSKTRQLGRSKRSGGPAPG